MRMINLLWATRERPSVAPKCWAAPLFGTPCRGRRERAHIGLAKQTLRRAGLPEDQVWDHRIWQYVCQEHHALLDGPNMHLWKTQLPDCVIEYAKEKGLEYRLDEADLKRRQTSGPGWPE